MRPRCCFFDNDTSAIVRSEEDGAKNSMGPRLTLTQDGHYVKMEEGRKWLKAEKCCEKAKVSGKDYF